jgi:hypothetical protein
MLSRTLTCSLVFLSLLVSISSAANITLSFGECRATDSDMVCAPIDPGVNGSTIYQACIHDSQVAFNLSGINSRIQDANNRTETIMQYLNNSLKPDLQEISGLLSGSNLSFVAKYVECAMQLNLSQITEHACTNQIVNTTIQLQELQTQFSTCTYTYNDTVALQNRLKQESDAHIWYFAAGIVVVLAVIYYRSSQKKVQGEPMMHGTSPKGF